MKDKNNWKNFTNIIQIKRKQKQLKNNRKIKLKTKLLYL